MWYWIGGLLVLVVIVVLVVRWIRSDVEDDDWDIAGDLGDDDFLDTPQGRRVLRDIEKDKK